MVLSYFLERSEFRVARFFLEVKSVPGQKSPSAAPPSIAKVGDHRGPSKRLPLVVQLPRNDSHGAEARDHP